MMLVSAIKIDIACKIKLVSLRTRRVKSRYSVILFMMQRNLTTEGFETLGNDTDGTPRRSQFVAPYF